MDFFRRKILPLLRGRYLLVSRGRDALSTDLIWVSLILIVLSWILTFCRAFIASYVLYALSLAAIFFSAFRMLSRNIGKRESENRWYLFHKNRLIRFFSEARERFRNRKVYRYVACPQCRKRLRLPRGKGALTVTCPECGKKFDAKT